jgi:hypothetical protein
MQTVKKGVWLDPIGISHSLDHVMSTMVVLVIFCTIHYISAISIIVIAFLEGIIHYLIDYTKVKYGCKDNTKPLFWNQFGLDQLAHQVCYLVMAGYLLV